MRLTHCIRLLDQKDQFNSRRGNAPLRLADLAHFGFLGKETASPP